MEKNDVQQKYSESGVQKHTEALEFGVHHISQAVAQVLCHIRSGHQSNTRTQHLQKCLKGMPKLPAMQHVEKCVSCTTAKLKKKARGAKITHPVNFPFQGIKFDPGFMFHTSKESQRVKALESYNGHNAYLLMYCVNTKVMCGQTTKEKVPTITLAPFVPLSSAYFM